MNSEIKTNETLKKQRSSNFELLRIISMLLIVAYHYCIHGNHHSIFQSDISVNQIIAIVFGSWGLLGVDCFVFISAYFLIGSQRFGTKKLLKILFQTSFYSIAFVIYLIMSKSVVLSRQDIVQSIFSPLFNQYWFITSYCLLYTIYPFLNKMISGMSIKALSRLILVLTVFVPVYRVYVTQAPIDDFLFFIYLYLIMGYLKQSRENWFEVHAKKGFLLTTLFIIFYDIATSAVGTFWQLPGFQSQAFRFATRYSPFMILDAIFLFYIFKNLRIGASKIINTMAGATLGIYLLHEYPLVRPLLWDGLLQVDQVYQSNLFFACLILSVLCIYITGTIIDLLRLYLIEKPLLLIRIQPLEKLFHKFDQWINEE